MSPATTDRTATRLHPLATDEGCEWVPLEVMRVKGSRHIRIVVDNGTITLRLPWRAAERDGLRFLETQAGWVAETLRKQAQRPDLLTYLRRARALSAGGRRVVLTLACRSGPARFRWLPGEAPQLEVSFDAARDVETEVAGALKRWARDVIPVRVAELAARHEIDVGRITVRDQRGRWGSCAASGNLSLNWRLILLPASLHDYVILHELAHRRHFDHSQRFWAALAAMDPQARKHDRELTRQGRGLIGLGRPG